jgi:hypothetical protein
MALYMFAPVDNICYMTQGIIIYKKLFVQW